VTTYTIIGYEQIYDEMADCLGEIAVSPFTVRARSLKQAVKIGLSELRQIVNQRHRDLDIYAPNTVKIEQVLDSKEREYITERDDFIGELEEPSPILYDTASPDIEICRAVSEELLARLAEHPNERFRMHHRLFEETVAELLSRMGYSVRLTPSTRDNGRDILASISTPAATLLMLVECKRYAMNRPVGIEPITRLWYRLFDDHANIGMVVTTSVFQPVAQSAAANRGFQIALRDGEDFISWVRSLKKV
jgi:restriction endonuclease Mrr